MLCHAINCKHNKYRATLLEVVELTNFRLKTGLKVIDFAYFMCCTFFSSTLSKFWEPFTIHEQLLSNSWKYTHKWLSGLGVWFLLWVQEVPGSNPGWAQGTILLWFVLLTCAHSTSLAMQVDRHKYWQFFCPWKCWQKVTHRLCFLTSKDSVSAPQIP